MINDNLKKLHEEIEILQIKASALDEVGNLVNRYIIHKKKSIEVEIIKEIVYEAFDKTKKISK